MKIRRVLIEKFSEYDLGEEHQAPRPILGSDLIASDFLHSEIASHPGKRIHFQS